MKIKQPAMKKPTTRQPAKSLGSEFRFPEKGPRKAPDNGELRIFLQAGMHEGGARDMPAAARDFSSRFSAAITRYPARPELPNWLRAMIEKKVSVQELAQVLHDRVQRAPSRENQELALLTANEMARMQGGPAALTKHLTPELLVRLGGKGGKTT